MRGCSGCCWSYPPVYQDKCNIACLTSDGNLRWLNLVDVRQHLPGNVQAIVTGFYTSLGGTIDGITNATCIGDGRLLMLLIDVPSLDLYSLVLDAVTGAIVAAPQDLGIGGDTTAGDAIGFVPGAGGGIVLYRFVDLGGGEKQFRREFIDFTGTLSAHDGPTYTTGSNLQTLVSRHGQVITLLSDAEVGRWP